MAQIKAQGVFGAICPFFDWAVDFLLGSGLPTNSLQKDRTLDLS